MIKQKNFLFVKAQKAFKRGTGVVLCSVLMLLLVAGSCNKEEKQIIGSWKLIELKYPPYTDYGNQTVVNYTDSNIVFTFRANNTLSISGSMYEGYLPEGEYTYSYKIVKGSRLEKPGPSLYINNEDFWGVVSEKTTKLEIINADKRWSINLIKLKNNKL